ncbi:heparan-alpha-glucosaminide N-acetyltransferase-like [Corticium candelabrum]|uniref:heparan-alpha-glucosaminide N-acetyltransferase-like n=1 Tax=Corticium candelabrum TaxID=121492 RepID=UPI002E26B7C9|nr:heparan-alpha-glucosaminide N-acetyltransferase-like [Corticium candelabrum]
MFVLFLTFNLLLLLLIFGASEAELAVNEAHFCLTNDADFDVDVYVTYANCHNCRPRFLASSATNESNCTANISTSFDFRLSVMRTDVGEFLTGNCSNASLPHRAVSHSWCNVTVRDAQTCDVTHSTNEWPTYLPLVISIGILLLFGVFWVVFTQFLYDRLQKTLAWRWVFGNGATSVINDTSQLDYDTDEERQARIETRNHHLILGPDMSVKRRRLASLDAFRGISLILMIFVNYGGGGYWFFEHSTWNGLTVADLVFPWFIFILGTSAAISLNLLDQRDISRRRTFLKVVRRFVILFGLGLLLNKSMDLSTYRVMGVLQRLAICYLVICLLHLIFAPRARYDVLDQDRLTSVRDITGHLMEWITIVAIVTLHTLVTFFIRKKECPPGYLNAGGKLGDFGDHGNCTGGAAGYIDDIILTKSHMFQHPTCKETYLTGPFEPEGILSTLPAIVTAFLGMHAGRILIVYRSESARLTRWLLHCVVWGSIAIGLCEGKQDGGIIPINKNLWSLSYSLAMSASAFLLLSAFYFSIDVRKWWNGSPFIYPGRNSILVYVGHEIVFGWFPFGWSSDETHANLMARNLTGTALWVVISYYLYTIKFFLKI